jgi:hypothetical protein
MRVFLLSLASPLAVLVACSVADGGEPGSDCEGGKCDELPSEVHLRSDIVAAHAAALRRCQDEHEPASRSQAPELQGDLASCYAQANARAGDDLATLPGLSAEARALADRAGGYAHARIETCDAYGRAIEASAPEHEGWASYAAAVCLERLELGVADQVRWILEGRATSPALASIEDLFPSCWDEHIARLREIPGFEAMSAEDLASFREFGRCIRDSVETRASAHDHDAELVAGVRAVLDNYDAICASLRSFPPDPRVEPRGVTPSLVAADVASDPLALEEDLHGHRGDPDVDLFVDEAMRR